LKMLLVCWLNIAQDPYVLEAKTPALLPAGK
jgi:hypothetical protein